MNFHINWNGFVSTLPVMLNGMLGGMLVMLLICAVLMGLYWIGRRKKKDSKNT